MRVQHGHVSRSLKRNAICIHLSSIYIPANEVEGYIGFSLSVCLSVCLSVHPSVCLFVYTLILFILTFKIRFFSVLEFIISKIIDLNTGTVLLWNCNFWDLMFWIKNLRVHCILLIIPHVTSCGGYNVLTRPSVGPSVRQSCFSCQQKSSETAQQNFVKLCSYGGHNV